MDNFESVDMRYTAFSNNLKADAGIRILFYHDHEFNKFRSCLRELFRQLGNFGLSSSQEVYLRFFQSLRNSLFLEPFNLDTYRQFFSEISATGKTNAFMPKELKLVSEIDRLASRILARESVPAVEFLFNLATRMQSGRTLVTFRRSTSAEYAKKHFSDRISGDIVFDSQARRSDEFFENNIIFGPLDWYSERIVLRPIADHIVGVLPSGHVARLPEFDSNRGWFQFGTEVVPKLNIMPPMFPVDSIEIEQVPMQDVEAEVYVSRPPNNESPYQTALKTERCRQVFLRDDGWIFLDIDGDFIHVVELVERSVQVVSAALKKPGEIEVGDYLVVRKGSSDQVVFRTMVKESIGAHYDAIAADQMTWKSALIARLVEFGKSRVERELEAIGVIFFRQTPYWATQSADRPRSEEDFLALLRYLGLGDGARFLRSANALRSASRRVRIKFRKDLQHAIQYVDSKSLISKGFVVIEAPITGIADLLISRVVSISPMEYYIEPSRVRVLHGIEKE
jgi:hypothetical protein